MDGRERTMAVIYVCWNCDEDFEVAERDGLSDSLEVTCPGCGSDLVAVDLAAVRHSRPEEPRRRSSGAGSGVEPWADRRAR
jgi:DNA-directed RNA polymerase subunit RPC12/RpoP